jgi:hypothetical protein
MSSSASSVCASPLPLQFPLPAGSSAASPLTPPLGRIVYTQPASLAGAGGFAVISPSGGGFAALQVIGAGHQLSGAGEAVLMTPPCCMCLYSDMIVGWFVQFSWQICCLTKCNSMFVAQISSGCGWQLPFTNLLVSVLIFFVAYLCVLTYVLSLGHEV